MTTTQQQRRDRDTWTPLSGTVAGALAAAIAVFASQFGLLPLAWWSWFGVGVIAAAALTLLTLIQAERCGPDQEGLRWAFIYLGRVAAALAVGVWLTFATRFGWSQLVFLAGLGVATGVLGAAYGCRAPQPPAGSAAAAPAGQPGLNGQERRWQDDIVACSVNPKRAPTVVKVEPWPRAKDGESVYVRLRPAMRPRDLEDLCETLPVQRELPPGCKVTVRQGPHQGIWVLDVMLRDCIADVRLVEEDYTPASINDYFTVMYSPSGEPQDICMRTHSTLIGGAPDAGKTTLLHRIVMFLARCKDTVVWLVDPNGGGLADPWVGPWARDQQRCPHPTIDWVADTPEEAAALGAVATAIAKDRKTESESQQRMRDDDSTVLRVDADKPALVVLADEGAELMQAGGLLAEIALQRATRLAQIGRAVACRVVLSVLRGTADTADRRFKVAAGNRIALKCETDDEYQHILDRTPTGNTRLIHKGSGYLLRSSDPHEIFGRTMDVRRSQMERCAVATAELRPALDARARHIASLVTPVDILDGRDPANYPGIMDLPIMRDAAEGLLYERRWERYAARLEQLRASGGTVPDPATIPTRPPQPAAPTTPQKPPPPMDERLAAFVATADALKPAAPPAGPDLSDPAEVDREAARLLSGVGVKLTAKEYILAELADAYPQRLQPSQIRDRLIRKGRGCTREHVQVTLAALRGDGLVQHDPAAGEWWARRD